MDSTYDYHARITEVKQSTPLCPVCHNKSQRDAVTARRLTVIASLREAYARRFYRNSLSLRGVCRPVNVLEALATRTPIPLGPISCEGFQTTGSHSLVLVCRNKSQRDAVTAQHAGAKMPCWFRDELERSPCRNFAKPCYGLLLQKIPKIQLAIRSSPRLQFAS
jgi:hypothetical protein